MTIAIQLWNHFVMPSVHDLNLQFDFEQIVLEIRRIVEQCPFFDQSNQISLRHRVEKESLSDIEKFQDGVGSLYDSKTGQWTAYERNFSVNHPQIRSSYLEKILHEVQEDQFCKVGRFRIMRLRAKTCYTWHKDPDDYRLHIPVVTNDSCFYLTEKGGMERLPQLGRLYKVETNIMHTALNASTEDRLHLVLSTC